MADTTSDSVPETTNTTTTPEVVSSTATKATPVSTWKPPAKGQFPINLNMAQQKPISELSLVDIFLWRNLFVSVVLFILTQAVYLLLTKYQFTVITLVGRVVQIQVIIFFLYIVFARIVKNTSGSIELPFTDFKVSKDMLEPYINAIVDQFNSVLSRYVDILMCKDLLKTIQFIVVVQLICVVGKKVEGIHSLYALLNILFIIPLVYEWQQDKIDALTHQGFDKVKQVWSQVMEKIPPNVRDQVAKQITKIQGSIEKEKSQ